MKLLNDIIYKKKLDLDISTLVKFIVLFDRINAKCINDYIKDDEYVEDILNKIKDKKSRCSSLKYRREEFLLYDNFVLIKRAIYSFLVHITPYLEDENKFTVYLIDNKYLSNMNEVKSEFIWKSFYNNEILFFELEEDGDIYKLDFSNRYNPIIGKFF